MMNCRPAEPLLGELKSFVEGAGQAGLIYVSFGAALNASEMDAVKRNMFLNVFRYP